MSRHALRIVFAGTPDFAAAHLRALLASDHQVLAVYTQPDRPAGRGRALQSSAVKDVAIGAGLPVRQPVTLRDADAQRQLAALAADVMVVVAYGLILPQAVLDTPRFGCLNVHASLLPRWRGAAPVQRAIEAGDTETGITIMRMDAGLDTGPMLASARRTIGAHTDAGELLAELALLGPPLLLEVLGGLHQQAHPGQPQDDALASYAHKILKSEAAIDWRQSADVLERRVRAFNPAPVCYSVLGGKRLRIWRAHSLPGTAPAAPAGTVLRADGDGVVVACGQGALALEMLQFEGGRPLPAAQALNAQRSLLTVGNRFDPPPAALP